MNEIIADLPLDDRPRERLLAHGPETLSDAELIAILLGSGVPLFRDAGRIRLELAETRVIDGGCVLSIYRVVANRGEPVGGRRKARGVRRNATAN